MQGDVPVGRDMHAMTALGDRLYVFGGRLRQETMGSDWGCDSSSLTSELWSFNVKHFEWTLLDEVRATAWRCCNHDEGSMD